MSKEILICIVCIVLIVILDIITQNYTKNSVQILGGELVALKKLIENEDDNIDKIIKDLQNEWESRYKKMAYYIEHDELEKVETELSKIKSNIDTKEYEQGIESIDTSMFLLEHIKDKTSLKWQNLF